MAHIFQSALNSIYNHVAVVPRLSKVESSIKKPFQKARIARKWRFFFAKKLLQKVKVTRKRGIQQVGM
jgi:hypothetical protein